MLRKLSGSLKTAAGANGKRKSSENSFHHSLAVVSLTKNAFCACRSGKINFEIFATKEKLFPHFPPLHKKTENPLSWRWIKIKHFSCSSHLAWSTFFPASGEDWMNDLSFDINFFQLMRRKKKLRAFKLHVTNGIFTNSRVKFDFTWRKGK